MTRRRAAWALAAALLPVAPLQGRPQPTVRVHHLHVRTDTPAPIAETIRAAGGSRAIAQGLGAELPDRFWCPMHPHVRSPAPATCPICSMSLVPIAPPRAGEYRLDVTQVPSRRGGIRALKLRIRDPDTGGDVAMFAEAHERLLHLFIVGRDLEYFAHEHPRRTGDGFELPVDLPPGAYMVIADFLPGGGNPQMVHRAIVTPGFRASPFASITLQEDAREKTAGAVRVALAVDALSWRPAAVLRFRLTDTDGVPITDLEPYLGSAGHLLVVSPDLTHSIHAHPDAVGSGPELAFDVEFPEPGIYKLWVQIQRRGTVSAVPFVVRIGPADHVAAIVTSTRHGTSPSTRRRLPRGRTSGDASQYVSANSSS